MVKLDHMIGFTVIVEIGFLLFAGNTILFSILLSTGIISEKNFIIEIIYIVILVVISYYMIKKK